MCNTKSNNQVIPGDKEKRGTNTRNTKRTNSIFYHFFSVLAAKELQKW
jgi:hypothetical protein